MGELGTLCFNRRKELGLTLRAVGEVAECSFVTVRDIETGNVLQPTRETLLGLATALELPIADLALASYGVSAAK